MQDECTRATLSTVIAWVRLTCAKHESGTIEVARSKTFKFAYCADIANVVKVFWPQDDRYKSEVLSAVEVALGTIGAHYTSKISENGDSVKYSYDFTTTTRAVPQGVRKCPRAPCKFDSREDSILCDLHHAHYNGH